MFSTPHELWSFWTGPLAAAFGIEAASVGVGRGHDRRRPPPALPRPRACWPISLRAKEQPPEEGSERGKRPSVALRVDETGPPPRPERRLTAASLAAELGRVIHGQEPALERVASAVVAQLTKRHPARPGSVLLIGPTGVGKTTTVEALPAALRALGYEGARVFRLDCGELTDSIQLTRLLGSPPGYSGHTATTPLITTLERPGCILLVDELEKAHPDVLDLLLGLLDAGRLRNPAGHAVNARHIVIALTTSMASDELTLRLGRIPLEDRWAIQRTCADHLRASGYPLRSRRQDRRLRRLRRPRVRGRPPRHRPRRGRGARARIRARRGSGRSGRVEVVEDIAADGGSSGARALHHAARELLAEQLRRAGGRRATPPCHDRRGPPPRRSP